MAKPAPVKLEPIYYGDTWDGLSAGSVTDDGAPPENALASMRMFFRPQGADPDSAASLELTSANGKITITDAAAWGWIVEPVERFTLELGNYDWSIEFTDAANVRTTDVVGTLQVLNDATR